MSQVAVIIDLLNEVQETGMKLRPTHFARVDRHGEAAGVTILELPFRELWLDAESRFVRKVVKQLCMGRTPRDPERLLERAQLGADARSFAEWFAGIDPPGVEIENNFLDGLRRLAARAEDLARDHGDWAEDARQLDGPADQAIADFEQRIRTLTQAALANHGPKAAKDLLERLRRLIEQSAATQRRPERWSIDHTAELDKCARELRALAQPVAAVRRALVKVWPKVPLRFVVGAIERSVVVHQLLPVIERAASLRFQHEREKRLEQVQSAILGSPGRPGLIDQAIAELDREIAFFRQIAPPSVSTLPSPQATALHIIPLVDGLDDVIDRASGRTLAHVLGAAIRQSGCTARAFADRIREVGITIRGRVYPIAEWSRYLTPAEARRALEWEVAQYLGSADRNAPIDIAKPRTAFEHAAAITPLHPALRARLQSLIPLWIRQSKPYLDGESILGAEPIVHTFLYCYSQDRATWEKLLYAQVTICNPRSATGVSEAFATGHPYAVILAQYALVIPLGAIRCLPHCTSQSNLLRRTKSHRPNIDRNDYPETRLLPTRPSDYADCESLFEAALQAKIVLPVPSTSGPTRFAITNVDARLASIFAPDILEPDLVTDDTVHALLADRSVREFVSLTFSNAADFHAVAERLLRENDSRIVAAELVRRGILTAGPPRHYLLNVAPQGDHGNAPESLFRRRRGPLVGLLRDEFIAELHRDNDDVLYNALAWRVVDAIETGHLSPNAVPAFLHRFVRTQL